MGVSIPADMAFCVDRFSAARICSSARLVFGMSSSAFSGEMFVECCALSASLLPKPNASTCTEFVGRVCALNCGASTTLDASVNVSPFHLSSPFVWMVFVLLVVASVQFLALVLANVFRHGPREFSTRKPSPKLLAVVVSSMTNLLSLSSPFFSQQGSVAVCGVGQHHVVSRVEGRFWRADRADVAACERSARSVAWSAGVQTAASPLACRNLVWRGFWNLGARIARAATIVVSTGNRSGCLDGMR